MKEVFDAVNQVFDFVVPIADFLWGFPTNFDWYASIPILGNLSFAIVILIGSGIFFSIKTGFIQVTHFRKGLRILIDRKTATVGITPLAAFFLSSAMRVGPGNIMGVTGAIAVGGPGAFVLDVGQCLFRHGNGIYGSHTGADFQRKKRR